MATGDDDGALSLELLVKWLALANPIEHFGPFTFCMLGYCLHFAVTLLPATRKLPPAHSFGLTLLTAFGGGTAVPVLLGAPAYILWDDRAIPILLVAWAGARFLTPLRTLAATTVGDVMLTFTFQVSVRDASTIRRLEMRQLLCARG